ncbi:MAG: aspartate/glutamate racemase family protein [Candidatus Hodarchaeota archaeon]
MEILYLMPGSGMPPEEIRRREEVANSIARNSSIITVTEVGEGPLSIESAIEEYMSIGPMLEYMLDKRIEDSYNAVIIGCAGDPGLKPARELLDIPIIGPAESSYLFACMISDRFSILSTLQAGVPSDSDWRVKMREMSLEPRLASVEFIELSVTDMWGKNAEKTANQIEKCVQSAVEKGAGSVVLGCMSMAFLLVDEIVHIKEAPIVNPLKTAIKTAETLVDLNARHSRSTYPAADFDKLRRTLFTKD